ncbi:MAG: hypothetical protein KGI38_10825 [Thaumarchaeota archaeon]|nr:hypothetical protein [Nitrososphaerota archaeon]
MLAQMLKVDAHLTRLRTSLVAIRPPDWSKVTFDLQADIKPVSRDGSKLKLRYSIGLETFPVVYRAEIGGFANANVEMLSKDESLEDLGEAVLSDIAVQIFRQNFEPLYLALTTLGLDAPSPWLVKDVHLAH